MESDLASVILAITDRLIIWFQQKSLLDVVLSFLATTIFIYLAFRLRGLRREFRELTRDIDVATNRFQAIAGDLRNLIAQFDDIFASKVAVVPAPVIASGARPPPTKGTPDDPFSKSPSPPNPQPDVNTEDDWESLREVWEEAKNMLEDSIETIGDGRKLRKYAGMPRHKYNNVIAELLRDGILTGRAAEAATTLNKLFLSYRSRKRAVPGEEVERARSLLKQIRAIPQTDQ